MTSEQRERAVGVVQMEATHVFIARTFGCYRVVVNKLDVISHADRPDVRQAGTGRTRVTTLRGHQYSHTLHLRNRFLTGAP